MKKLFVIVMMFLLGACVVKPKVVDMAVDFDGTGDGINYGAVSATGNLAQKSICAWLIMESWSTNTGRNEVLTQYETLTGYRLELQQSGATSVGYVQYLESFSTNPGIWITNANPITLDSMLLLCTTFDHSSVSNNPILYVNGASYALTEISTPIGTALDTIANDLVVGNARNIDGVGDYPYAMNGKIFDVKIYNRILTPEEVVDLYNSRCKITNDNGLVFHAMLDGASGLTNFDGSTLASTNTLVDRIGGAAGTPAGNPTGYGDDKLSVCSP